MARVFHVIAVILVYCGYCMAGTNGTLTSNPTPLVTTHVVTTESVTSLGRTTAVPEMPTSIPPPPPPTTKGSSPAPSTPNITASPTTGINGSTSLISTAVNPTTLPPTTPSPALPPTTPSPALPPTTPSPTLPPTTPSPILPQTTPSPTLPQTMPSPTLPPTTPSPTLPPTTPSPGNTWEVYDKKNVTCQKMQFRANISVRYLKGPDSFDTVTIFVPSSSNASGDCSSSDKREFALSFIPENGTKAWGLKLVFQPDKQSKGYQLTSLAVEFSYDDKDLFVNPQRMGKYVYSIITTGTPVANIRASSRKKAFSCDTASVQSDSEEQLNVSFSELELQPFADMNNGGFGNTEECPHSPSPSSTSAPENPSSLWMPVSVAFIVFSAVLLLALVGYYVYVRKRRNKSSDTYSLMETY